MPLKSWAFECDGHPVRAEIGWRLIGRTRRRLYVDHQRVTGRRGRFDWGRPLTAKITSADGSERTLDIRFKPRHLGFDMACTAMLDGQPFRWTGAGVQVEKQRVFEDDPSHRGRSLGCFVVFPLLLVMMILYGPLCVAGAVVSGWSERLHRRRMRRSGRLLDWSAVQELVRVTPGTLILQTGNLASFRAWWTPDDVPSASPLPPPGPGEVMHPGRVDHPFIEWCWSRYLSEATGTAFLSELPKDVFADLDLYEAADPLAGARDRCPSMSVVTTGFVNGKKRAAAERFTGMLGTTLADSVPALTAALDDADPTLRRLCRETLELAGSTAEGAVPALARRLYLGPWKERYFVAKTLAAVGPAGLAALRKASKLGDPRISGDAVSALRVLEHRKSKPATRAVNPGGAGG